jgi:hypothetical protein
MSVVTIGANASTSRGTAVTTSVNNTKGDWVELEDSTTADAHALVLIVSCRDAVTDCLIDIGTGAASSEAVLIANIFARAVGFHNQIFYFPVAIASGTRVAIRYQAGNAAATVNTIMYLLNNTTDVPLTECTPTTYGAVTADSGGTAIDPGAVAHTKGSYTEIEDSTTDDIDWLYVIVGRTDGGISNTDWLIDIATGAAASESIVIPDIWAFAHATTDVHDPYAFGPFPVSISSGTRLAARAQCTSTDATDRLIDVVLIGYDGTAASGSGGGGFSAWIGK